MVRKQCNHYERLVASLNDAIRLNWPDGEGREAMRHFLDAAGTVCDQHNAVLQSNGVIQPIRQETKANVYNYGGNSPLNIHNSRYAMKMMEPVDAEVFEDLVDTLPNPEIWHDPRAKESDPVTTWYFRNDVPDCVLQVKRTELETLTVKIEGLLVGAVRSSDEIGLAAESQAFVQALRGLMFRPTSAAVIIAPQSAVFIHIALENGFINTRKKRYTFRPRTKEDLEVDASAFKELFRDIVLYLWNTHFESRRYLDPKCL